MLSSEVILIYKKKQKKCLCLCPNVSLVPGWIGSILCNWHCLIVPNITAFWEQNSLEMKLTQIQSCRDAAHLCFIQSAMVDLCLYDWSFNMLDKCHVSSEGKACERKSLLCPKIFFKVWLFPISVNQVIISKVAKVTCLKHWHLGSPTLFGVWAW